MLCFFNRRQMLLTTMKVQTAQNTLGHPRALTRSATPFFLYIVQCTRSLPLECVYASQCVCWVYVILNITQLPDKDSAKQQQVPGNKTRETPMRCGGLNNKKYHFLSLFILHSLPPPPFSHSDSKFNER